MKNKIHLNTSLASFWFGLCFGTLLFLLLLVGDTAGLCSSTSLTWFARFGAGLKLLLLLGGLWLGLLLLRLLCDVLLGLWLNLRLRRAGGVSFLLVRPRRAILPAFMVKSCRLVKIWHLCCCSSCLQYLLDGKYDTGYVKNHKGMHVSKNSDMSAQLLKFSIN